MLESVKKHKFLNCSIHTFFLRLNSFHREMKNLILQKNYYISTKKQFPLNIKKKAVLQKIDFSRCRKVVLLDFYGS